MAFAFDLNIPVGHYIDTEVEARRWMNKFLQSHKERGGLGLDTETSGMDTRKDVVLVWSLSDGRDRICLPSQFLQLFKEPLLENPDINFDFTNAKFDAHMLANTGIDVSKAGQWRDTVVQSWLLNENKQGRHGLKECIQECFGRNTPTFEQVFGKTRPARPATKRGLPARPAITTSDLIYGAFSNSEKREAASDYSSLDAYNSTSLREFFDKKLQVELLYDGVTLFDLYYSVDVPFTKVLWLMERRGVTVDVGYLKELQPSMVSEMGRIEREFNKAAGKILNLNSPKQLRWFFFDLLKKKPVNMTDGGKSGIRMPSTDEEVLETWAGQGDAHAQLLLKHRKLAKIHNTYIKGLFNWLDPWYRIHTSLNQTGTVTGRLSSSEPNLQNIPRSSEDRFKIREAFIAGAHKELFVADYEQPEMRLMAHFSRDEKMIKAILDGLDLHCLTVTEIYGIPYKEVMEAKDVDKLLKKGKLGRELSTRELELVFYRQAAKATGFGIIYGIGGEHLAANLTQELGRLVTKEEGFDLINKWFSVFPSVKVYVEATKKEILRAGRVQTIMGRYRRLGDIRYMSRGDAKQAERQGVNSIIQGTAADIAKMAMLKAEHDEELSKLNVEMLLQVHDELIFEGPMKDELVIPIKQRIKHIMENPFETQFLVPIPVDVGNSYSWAGAK